MQKWAAKVEAMVGFQLFLLGTLNYRPQRGFCRSAWIFVQPHELLEACTRDADVGRNVRQVHVHESRHQSMSSCLCA
jgi:hypothetical protein